MTPRQKACLDHIEAFERDRGYMPSLAELAGLLGLVTRSAVHKLLDGLEEQGWIMRTPNRRRSIEIVRRQAGSSGVAADLSTFTTVELWAEIMRRKDAK